MKTVISVILPLALIFALFIGCDEDDSSNGPGPGPIYTEISGDQTGTLDLARSPYLVVGDLSVPQGQTLTIEPGVVLEFEGLYWLKVDGQLTAVGNTSNAIVFTSHSSSPTYGDWRNLIFTNPDDQSHMSYCVVEYGALYDTTELYYTYRGGIAIINSSPIIEHTVIYKVGFNGIYMAEGAAPIIRNNIITENDDNGIFCNHLPTPCNPTIEYNDIYYNHSRSCVECPPGVLDTLQQVNVNLDSCDIFYNISLDPMFVEEGEFDLVSCSPCINAGDPTLANDPDASLTDMGPFYYHIDPNNIRKKVEGTLVASLSPYRVTCDAFVLEGSSLTIDPGVEIQFEGFYRFDVYGSLWANGTSNSPVAFTTNQTDPARGFWRYLIFHPSSISNSLTYCSIDHGQGIIDSAAVLTMDHVTVLEMEEFGLYAWVASPVITNCVFNGAGLACIQFDYYASNNAQITNTIITGAEGRGISLDYHCTPTISNCVIYNNGTSGIHCEDRSDATIVNNTIYGNGYYGIYCFWNSSPVVMNNIITNSDLYGIYSQYSSVPVISYNDVWNNHLSVADSLRFNYYGDYCEADSTDISLDPMFVNALSADFHLSSESPCIDAGNPDPAYNDSDGSPNDMGAHGGPGGN